MSIEEVLAARLHDLTPTPPRDVSVDDIAQRVQAGGEPRRTRPVGWMSAVAAAAVVGLLVAGVVALRNSNSSQGPILQPTLTTTRPAPTPTTSAPPVVDGLHAASCTAAQRFPLDRVLKPVTVVLPTGYYNFAGLPILSITTDGDVLAGTAGAGSINPARLDLIRPDGSRTTLYKATDVPLTTNESADIAAAQGDPHWIVFAVAVGGGQKDLRRLGFVNRNTGQATTFRTLPAHSTAIMSEPILFQGHAYWSEVDGNGTGSIYSFDPSTGITRTVDNGDQLGIPTVIGGGLYWQRNGQVFTYRHGKVPTGFPLGATKFPTFATDGTVTVWAQQFQSGVQLLLSTPRMKAPLVLLHSTTTAFIPLAVDGPYVVWDDTQHISILDTRTGATAVVQDSRPMFDTVQMGDGTIAENQTGSKGGAQLAIGQLAALPKLTC